ncbi:MAG: flagellar biosynthesis protein FlhB [Kordiimonadaceae bacterium]|nr:flagellar biosynthesis protein FlhB [Kordiimonadaceae bacterium]MBO6570081.1 flagellar biosynthesis protein FlhB [Kordiimonadaceae bacterium]MBO6965822.1 flagellar biosynthesis protein FlhB [Kordiimonadaceae bacterium]
MAEEDDSQKTEEPTPKKLEEARKKGEVAQSQELKTWFMLAAGAAVLAGAGNRIGAGIRDPLRGYMGRVHAIEVDGPGTFSAMITLLVDIVLILMIPLGVFIVAAIVGNRIQHSGVFTLEKLKPDITKLNPVNGLKKFGSSKIPVDLAKALGKLVALGVIVFLIVYPERSKLDTIMLLPPIEILQLIHLMAVKLIVGVLILLTIIAAADFSYQKYQHTKKLRMTKQEVKDERKQTDGDPKVKSRLRAIRMERHVQRMMAAVPRADVVITNPTHYAVALEYKHGQMDVPVLIAKGVDDVAMRIREVAQEHGVPFVENPPLARALFASVEIDDEVPPDHYKAVAEVISYVMKLRRSGLAPRAKAS